METKTSAQLLTFAEASHRLGVTTSCLRKWVRRGRLPQVRVGTKATRIPIEAIEELMKAGWRDALPA
ncbi:MAG: helix-turn-helix transcriptional regulator [Pseudomonadota bacterium]